MIEYAESYRPNHPRADSCKAIAARLQPNNSPLVEPQLNITHPQQVKRMRIEQQPIEIFFSYAHEDEELMDEVRLQLVVRERLGQIVKWHDRMIPAGNEWKTQIDHRIEHAHVILLFMSPNFLASSILL